MIYAKSHQSTTKRLLIVYKNQQKINQKNPHTTNHKNQFQRNKMKTNYIEANLFSLSPTFRDRFICETQSSEEQISKSQYTSGETLF